MVCERSRCMPAATGGVMGQVRVPERWLLVLWDVDHTLIENNGINKET